MDFQRLVLTLSKITKKKLTNLLIDKYGKNYKTPLAKALGVNVSTVRRKFNSDKELLERDVLAIMSVING